jgi:hypothetical protein
MWIFKNKVCTFLQTHDPFVFAIFMNLDFPLYYSINEKVSFKVVAPKLL